MKTSSLRVWLSAFVAGFGLLWSSWLYPVPESSH